jgi:hypothetical protein
VGLSTYEYLCNPPTQFGQFFIPMLGELFGVSQSLVGLKVEKGLGNMLVLGLCGIIRWV